MCQSNRFIMCVIYEAVQLKHHNTVEPILDCLCSLAFTIKWQVCISYDIKSWVTSIYFHRSWKDDDEEYLHNSLHNCGCILVHDDEEYLHNSFHIDGLFCSHVRLPIMKHHNVTNNHNMPRIFILNSQYTGNTVYIYYMHKLTNKKVYSMYIQMRCNGVHIIFLLFTSFFNFC